MKKFTVVLFLVLCSAFVRAEEKPNPADFTVKVHISASSIPNFDLNELTVMSAEATLNGRKIKLSGRAVLLNNNGQTKFASNAMLIAPGDYQARLVKDVHNSDSTAIHQEYDLLLTDGVVWHCTISGISE
jgi:hypothetical protein